MWHYLETASSTACSFAWHGFDSDRFLTLLPSSFPLPIPIRSVFLGYSAKHKTKMGKVHGSLARAGKVKGQTPKVEKQEDTKKQPRGRAKKRMQYNRRYVNVVTGMGGKRVGPNSNADKMK
jgi:small subunit ribosomal protein S30e